MREEGAGVGAQPVAAGGTVARASAGCGPHEVYRPRAVSHHGVWEIGRLRLKVYGLLVADQALTADQVDLARAFVEREVIERVEAMGESNDLGFLIIHPGTLGISILAQWWAQGSVLCQHIYRRAYSATEPMDTVTRPVVACVWELALINAEQEAWRTSMMVPGPDPEAYLRQRPSCTEV
ncbi:MAG: hypothetical protein AAF416_11980 [Pseudomonadota bacterium]